MSRDKQDDAGTSNVNASAGGGGGNRSKEGNKETSSSSLLISKEKNTAGDANINCNNNNNEKNHVQQSKEKRKGNEDGAESEERNGNGSGGAGKNGSRGSGGSVGAAGGGSSSSSSLKNNQSGSSCSASIPYHFYLLENETQKTSTRDSNGGPPSFSTSAGVGARVMENQNVGDEREKEAGGGGAGGNNSRTIGSGGEQQQQQQQQNNTDSRRSRNKNIHLAHVLIQKELAELDEDVQVNFVGKFGVGDTVEVCWTNRGEGPWITDIAECVRVVEDCDEAGQQRRNVNSSNNNNNNNKNQKVQRRCFIMFTARADCNEIGEIELPTNDANNNIIIRTLQKVDRPILWPPNYSSLRGMMFNHFKNRHDIRHVIYVDGGTTQAAAGLGARKNGLGESSASLVYVDLRLQATEKHARYYAESRTDIMEWTAWLAAVKFVKQRKIEDLVLVVSDQQHISTTIQRGIMPADELHRSFYRQIVAEKPQNVINAHMLRKDGNPADEVGKDARKVGQAIGDSSLFIITEIRNKAPLAKKPPSSIQVAVDIIGQNVQQLVEQIKSVDDFAELHRFRSRHLCPRGCEVQWSMIVKEVTSRIIKATNVQDRSDALIGFLCLPTLFMHSRASTTTILKHLERGVGFNILLHDQHQQQQPVQNQDGNSEVQQAQHQQQPRVKMSTAAFDQRDALSRTVERKANEGCLRQAVKLMQANCETERRSFEESCEQVQQKFTKREATEDFPPEPIHHIVPFTENQVFNVIRTMAKTAATAIDGWTQPLMFTAVRQDHSIAADLGIIVAMIMQSHADETPEQQRLVFFNKIAMDIIRAARCLGIPKPEGGTRPICISGFLTKLTGALTLKRANIKQLPHQYAIATQDGAKRIIHLARDDYERGKCVIRIDLRNAYNETKRKRILQQLKDEERDVDLIAYFSTMYQPASKMYMFGPRGAKIMFESDEGVRQGDSPSSLFFCLVTCKATTTMVERCKQEGIEMDIRGFMDDESITCEPEHAMGGAMIACECFEQIGFTVNKEKSAMICRAPIPRDDNAALPFKIFDQHTEQFRLLGGVINTVYEDMNAMLLERINKFFTALDKIDVHPEIKHTILHLCGKPKLLYFVETTPPQFSKLVVGHFEKLAKASFAKLINVHPDRITDERLYSIDGAAIPHYSEHAQELYTNSRTMALTRCKRPQAFVRLVNIPGTHFNKTCVNTENTSQEDDAARLESTDNGTCQREALYDSTWTHYLNQAQHKQMPQSFYVTALAQRCDVIPQHIRGDNTQPIACTCGVLCTTDKEIIAHAIKCHRMSQIHEGRRHTFLKSDLVNIARSYGIVSTIEPTNYHYNGDVKKRPDITFHVMPKPIVTDVTIVTPKDNTGSAAIEAASNKNKIHYDACAREGHVFIPFAMETYGHFDERCFDLIKKLSYAVPHSEQSAFKRDMHAAASTAMAEYRARAVTNACTPVQQMRPCIRGVTR